MLSIRLMKLGLCWEVGYAYISNPNRNRKKTRFRWFSQTLGRSRYIFFNIGNERHFKMVQAMFLISDLNRECAPSACEQNCVFSLIPAFGRCYGHTLDHTHTQRKFVSYTLSIWIFLARPIQPGSSNLVLPKLENTTRFISSFSIQNICRKFECFKIVSTK